MHEVSIAEGLIEAAVRECMGSGFNHIDHIKVRIGKASGVMPEALLFAFDIVKLETIASNALLMIEEVPVSGHCRDCKADFITEEKFVLSCPYCGSMSYAVTSGRELEITELEVS
jgi:hydrogenase nickel incorporation protein HypA/HybF